MKNLWYFLHTSPRRMLSKHAEISSDSFEGKKKEGLKTPNHKEFRGSADAVKEIHKKESGNAPKDTLNLDAALDRAQKKNPSIEALLRSDIQLFGSELQNLYQKGVHVSDLISLRAQCTALYSPDREVQDIIPTAEGIDLAVYLNPGESAYGIRVDFSGNFESFPVKDGVESSLDTYALSDEAELLEENDYYFEA